MWVCVCAVGHPRGGAKVQMYARDDKPAEALFHLADRKLFTNTCMHMCVSAGVCVLPCSLLLSPLCELGCLPQAPGASAE